MESGWLDRVYTHFLGRDLVFTFAGAIVLYAARYAFLNEPGLPEMTLFEGAGVILVSYTIGISTYIFFGKTRIIDQETMKSWYEGRIVVYDKLRKEKSPYTIIDIERRFFLLIFFGAVGAACLLGSLGIMFVWRLKYFGAFIKMNVQPNLPTIKEWIVVTAVMIEAIYLFTCAADVEKGLKKSWNEVVSSVKDDSA